MFWSGIHQSIRLRLIEWGISPEHTSLERIVRKTISIEASEEAYNREVHANAKVGPPKQEWGRFPNRTTGPRLYRPVEEGGGPSQNRRNDRLQANAVTPQQSNEDSRDRYRGCRGQGQRISRAKHDELQAAGKCFQCEEAGHDQWNCPRLHSVRRPTANAVNIESARRERTRRVRNSPEIRLTAVAIGTENGGEVDDATDDMRRAYNLCALEWGSDEQWTSMETRLDSRYFVYQYDTIVEPVVEIRDNLQLEMGMLEVAASQFADSRFRLGDVCLASANTDPICVREGGGTAGCETATAKINVPTPGMNLTSGRQSKT